MSGRDLHAFCTNYTGGDVETLTLRMKYGLGSSKYKPAEYKRLQAIVDAKRLQLDRIGLKVQRNRLAAKATRESSVLRQHRQVWSREGSRLQKAEEEADDDIQDCLDKIMPNGITDTAIFSLQDYGCLLETEREAFRTATVEPVHQLKEDLLFRQGEVQRQQQPSWERVMQQINFVKDQQVDIAAKLQAESLSLEEEIVGLGLDKYLSASDYPVNLGNIPEEVLTSECPYPELKDCLIQAFSSLSERYQRRLQDLQHQVETTDRFCGWCADDHQRFQFTLSQYTHDVPNHRALCMDMLQRLFPEKTQQELMEHERAWDRLRFARARLRVVTRQRQRDREELQARALATLQEARLAHQEELELHRGHQHQQDICSRLREKLREWRAQQEEVAKLEAAIASRRQEEEEAMLKRGQEKEAAVRSQHKEKVRQFYLQQQKRRETLEARDQERLANLRRVMEDQAKQDKERVLFRADMLQRRREEREAQALERLREEEEKQDRLEVLRNQVRVVAESDPERMLSDTEAWRRRLLDVKEFELQRPLYTYTDTQIVSDPRVRVEQALREAGLHNSQYAKEVQSVLNPLRPPRRDTQSTLKF